LVSLPGAGVGAQEDHVAGLEARARDGLAEASSTRVPQILTTALSEQRRAKR
jgi:hypothetical protein